MSDGEVEVGQIYRMRLKHPCGGWDWRVFRVGADIGLQCLTCKRRVMLERRRFDARARHPVKEAG